jgi:GNAT superfamily N-acetyltransferase
VRAAVYAHAMVITYEWRGEFDNGAVNALHAAEFNHRAADVDWLARCTGHSLGWVCARHDGDLVGFVNVAWDGGVHAFILDTVVAEDHRRYGIGAGLVAEAARQAHMAECDWLHVDFEDGLQSFYFDACGFEPTTAGLIALRAAPSAK